MNILVIDDNPLNLKAAVAQLSPDHVVTTAPSYDAGRDLLRDYDSESNHSFDAVLVDLLMPASRKSMGPDGYAFVGKEMPIGVFLAILAATTGAKFVGVFTDTDHHSHPASACFDAINEDGESDPTKFKINNSVAILSNARNWINYLREDNLAEVVSWQDKDTVPCVRAKNWKSMLDYLTSEA